MKALLCLMVISVAAMFASCAAVVVHQEHPNPASIAVAITNGFKTVEAGSFAVTLSAAVENDPSKRGVQWRLTANGTNCSPACGVLTPAPPPSFAASYIPPKSLPSGPAASPTIAAISVENEKASAKFSFTIDPASPISVAISGSFSTVTSAGPPIPLMAQTNDAQGVNWALVSNGTACSPVCGTLEISASPHLVAIYTPPPILASGVNPAASVSAVSISDPTKSAGFSFTILSAPSSNYVFLLRGFDSNSFPMAMAGVLVADVDGNITGGELDLAQGGKSVRAESLQGNFTTDTNFAGIIRGTITISNFTLPGTSIHPVFKFVLRSNELEASVIEFDGSGNLAAGSIDLQNGISTTGPTGVYAFGLDSDSPIGQRTVAAGAFDISTTGAIIGVADQSQAGAPLADQAEPLSGTVTVPDLLGRGTLSFTVAGITTNYAYYAVNAGQLKFFQTGGGFSFGTLLSGTANAHTLDFDSSNGVFQTSVIQLTGMETRQNSATISPDVAIGVLTVHKDNSVSLICDTNNAGGVATSQKLSGTLQSYDPNTGRGVLSIPGGFQAGFLDTAAFYLYDNGAGFLIDIDPSSSATITNRASSGTLARQVPGPFASNSISGNLIAVSGASSVPSIPNVAAAANADPDSSTFVAIAYATSQSGPLPNVSFQATYGLSDPASGRGTAVFPAGLYGDFTPQATAPASFYLISPNRFVTIGTQTGLPSGISLFAPD
jgi:hypothetical protein